MSNVRPDYETGDDKVREVDTLCIVSGKLGLHGTLADRFAPFDATFRDATGNVVAIAEVKSRSVPSDRYRTFIVSARKYDTLRRIAREMNVSAYLVVDWLDRIGLWDATDRDIPPTVTGGRTDRGDAFDTEPLVEIATINFTVLHYRFPPRAAWR